MPTTRPEDDDGSPHPDEGQVCAEHRRDLRHRKHENQIEEQFDERDRLRLTVVHAECLGVAVMMAARRSSEPQVRFGHR